MFTVKTYPTDASHHALFLLLMATQEVLGLAVVALCLGLPLVDEALRVVVLQLPYPPVALRLVLQLGVVHDAPVGVKGDLDLLALHVLVLALLNLLQQPLLLLVGVAQDLHNEEREE